MVQQIKITHTSNADMNIGVPRTQTAVEWLIEMISPYITDEKSNPLIEQAKQMEKEQIIDAYNNGQQIPPFDWAEKYYNETYKK